LNPCYMDDRLPHHNMDLPEISVLHLYMWKIINMLSNFMYDYKNQKFMKSGNYSKPGYISIANQIEIYTSN